MVWAKAVLAREEGDGPDVDCISDYLLLDRGALLRFGTKQVVANPFPLSVEMRKSLLRHLYYYRDGKQVWSLHVKFHLPQLQSLTVFGSWVKKSTKRGQWHLE